MRKILLIILILLGKNIYSQTLNSKIEITHNIYASGFDTDEYLYSTNKLEVKEKSNIKKLLSEINNNQTFDYIFENSQIDTLKIKNNPLELVQYYKELRIDWNNHQKEFISKKLRNVNTYKDYYKEYINNGCCVTMHQRYRDEFIIKIWENGILTSELKSRKSIGGFKIPWTNILNNTKNYNFNIEKIVLKEFGLHKKIRKPLRGKNLLKYLSNKIIDYNITEIYKLSAYTYYNEIKELETEFEIKYFGEVYGRGRYIWDEPQTFKIKLHNKKMLPNINLIFLASKTGKTIYSRDSIKNNYLEIVNRIQSIDFIVEYLKNNSESTLDIYFFNGKNINEYNIENVNGNPENWEKQDKYIESLKWYETSDIKPSFDINKAIKTSEKNYCGCNYRFKREFFEKSIFFEIRNKNKDSSVWFLLPDGRVLLYLMQGVKVLNYDYTAFGNKYSGMQYPCKIFDENGKIIERKK